MKQSIFVIGVLYLALNASSTEAKGLHSHSTKSNPVDVAMKGFVVSILHHNANAFLGFVSQSRGLRIVNTITAKHVPSPPIRYSELAKDFPKKGEDYQEFLIPYEGDEGENYYDRVAAVRKAKWKKVAPNKFIPAYPHPFLNSPDLYVKWTREKGRWVIEELGEPMP